MSEEKHHGGRRLATGDPKPQPQWRQKLILWFQNKRNRRIAIAVAIVLALVLVIAVAYNVMFQKPDVGKPDLPASTSSLDGESPDTEEDRVTIHTGNRKEDFYTFLVIGRDTAGGGNTDTILLAAYDVKNQKLNVMSIPRDTMVNIPYDIKRINAVYNYNGGGDSGMEALYKEISQLVGFVPDFQVVVEWEAVGKLVDAIGGVWFDVPVNMDYDDPTEGQDLHIHVKKGYQLLDGEAAMGVVRFRHSYVNGDLGRIEVQQDFLKAVVAQCLQIQNVTRIGELAQIFVDDVTTDLEVSNLLWFGKQAIFGGLTMDNVNFMTMPCTNVSAWSRTYQNYQSYVVANPSELVDLVNECFNPYEDDLLESELDIMIVNSDGTLSSSVGKVEDTRAAGSSSSSSGTTSSGNSGTTSSGTNSNSSGSGTSSGGGTTTAKPTDNTSSGTNSDSSTSTPTTSTPTTSNPTSEPTQSPDEDDTLEETKEPSSSDSDDTTVIGDPVVPPEAPSEDTSTGNGADTSAEEPVQELPPAAPEEE